MRGQKCASRGAGMLLLMTARYAIADVAALVGEPTRAAMLLAVLDGRALPAGELASEAGLSAAAASLHLAKLTRGGLLVVQKEGRHRYYRLASGDVAHALEALGVIATGHPPARALSPERAALRAARTCYDHLAGALAVALTQKMERERLVRPVGERDYAVTARGVEWLTDVMQIDVATLGPRVARRCLDWTERRPHVAGKLGAAILDRFFAMRWAAKLADSRALRITTRGRSALTELGLGEAARAIPAAIASAGLGGVVDQAPRARRRATGVVQPIVPSPSNDARASGSVEVRFPAYHARGHMVALTQRLDLHDDIEVWLTPWVERPRGLVVPVRRGYRPRPSLDRGPRPPRGSRCTSTRRSRPDWSRRGACPSSPSRSPRPS